MKNMAQRNSLTQKWIKDIQDNVGCCRSQRNTEKRILFLTFEQHEQRSDRTQTIVVCD